LGRRSSADCGGDQEEDDAGGERLKEDEVGEDDGEAAGRKSRVECGSEPERLRKDGGGLG
jgi:hypothetical protein